MPTCVPKTKQCCVWYQNATACDKDEICCGQYGNWTNSQAFCCPTGSSCCGSSSGAGVAADRTRFAVDNLTSTTAFVVIETRRNVDRRESVNPNTRSRLPLVRRKEHYCGVWILVKKTPVALPARLNRTHLVTTTEFGPAYSIRISDGDKKVFSPHGGNGYPHTPVPLGKGLALCSEYVYAVHADTGKVAWKSQAFCGSDAGMVLHGKRLFTAGGEDFFAVDIDSGQTIFSTSYSGYELFHMELIHDFVVASGTTTYFMFNVTDNSGTPVVNGTDNCPIYNAALPVVMDNAVVFCDLRAYDLKAGHLLWHYAGLSATVYGLVAADDHMLTVLTGEHAIGIDVSTQTELWTVEYKGHGGVSSGGTVYLFHHSLEAIDAKSGDSKWTESYNGTTLGPLSSNSNTNAVPPTALIREGFLYVPALLSNGTSPDAVLAIRLASHGITAVYQLGQKIARGPKVLDGKIYYSSKDHYLYAVDPFN